MKTKKKILAIIGSTRENSTNLRIVKAIAELTNEQFSITIFDKLAQLPHFNPDLDKENPPNEIVAFRQQIEKADGIIICTPEYVFSLPGSLKNALEWTVSTVIFTDKPIGLITASASGEKAHEELKLIMTTLGAKFTQQTQILIQGIKGKVEGNVITDEGTVLKFKELVKSLDELI
jgi:chromate reductase, NAD(P)H dehydrogenase (quinone)